MCNPYVLASHTQQNIMQNMCILINIALNVYIVYRYICLQLKGQYKLFERDYFVSVHQYLLGIGTIITIKFIFNIAKLRWLIWAIKRSNFNDILQETIATNLTLR